MRFLITSCLLLFALVGWAQTKKITGQVVDSQKEALIGAAVLEKGTANGTTTDIDGNFVLSVKDSGDVTLVISYVGIPPKEIAVGTQTNLNVVLEQDSKELDEVVVIGYGTVKKSDLTGAVSSLKPDDVKQVPSGNVMEAVQGKAAGVDITRTSGESGKAPNITIRGNRSVIASNEPLYIVDGVQYPSIQDINPGDIQSMEVLKDASSTAIYGSRGANGVIIITTKKGAAGEVKVSLNSYIGQSSVFAFPKAMNGEQYAELLRQSYRTLNPAATNVPDQTSLGLENYNNYANGVQTDYMKEVINKGVQKDIQLGVAGGTDKVRAYFSLDYFNEQGLLKNDNLNRYTGRLNLDYQVKKYLKVGAQTQITYYDQNKRANPVGNAAKTNPLTQPFNADGSIQRILGGRTPNPLLDEQPNTAVDKLSTLRVFPTLYAEVSTPIKGLTARTNLSINTDTRGEGIYNSPYSYTVLNNGLTSDSRASYTTEKRLQVNWQGILNYSTTIKKDHSIGLTALSELITNKYERFVAQSVGQLIPEQLYYNLQDNKTSQVSSNYQKRGLLSYAGRLTYSYKGKYLLTATARTDGASQLPEGKKWDFFPSVSAGWRISDEKFMDFQRTFSTIKLRGSWGIAGNAGINPYATQNNLSRLPFSFDENVTTAYVLNPTIGNPNTRWEKSTTVDIGLDLGIFKERITLTADYYTTKTNGLLLYKALPPSNGITQTVANVGQTQNKGLELTLNSVNIEAKKFRWSTAVTFMANREKVSLLSDGLNQMQILKVSEDGSASSQWVVVGSPTTSFFDFEKIGIWQENEADQAKAYGSGVGRIKIKDQNGDGKITVDDRTVVGSTVPKWSGGFNSEMKFFNFDFSFYFFARMGQTINYQYTYSPTGIENSLSTREYWTPENGSNDLPRPGLAIENQYLRTINYQDGSFLKLRNVTLGYTLPSSLTERFKISRLRVYVTGKNLWMWNKLKDYDSEMEGSLSFPTVRLFVGGINFEF